MIVLKLFKYQLLLYLFIIVFGVQNYFLAKYNFNWSFYEKMVTLFFGLSFITVLVSVMVLIIQCVAVFKPQKLVKKEVLYLTLNTVAYYGLIWTSMYLSTQTRF